MDIMLIGKIIQGHQLIMTREELSTEQLAGMTKKGWVLSQVTERQANFHYNFIRSARYRSKIVGL
jgi:hypothetical protein